MNEQNTVKGYKVFRPDWTCRGFQYQVGKSYEMDEEPIICERGYHFCTKLIDCYDYYDFDENNKVAEVTAYGKISIDENEKKSCTNKIKIEKAIDWTEVLNMVNVGKNCTGLSNSGDCNSGDYNSGYYNSGNHNSGDHNSGNHNSGDHNSGDYNSGNHNSGDHNSGNHNSGDHNSGYYNSGYYNSGNHNSGDYNSGYYNSGDYNSGDHNSGDHNSGYYNSGDYNVTNYSSGCFNTELTKMFLFNKLSDWTRNDWKNSNAKWILDNTLVSPIDPIMEGDMTEKEKEEHPEYQTTGYYSKRLSWEEISNRNQKKWNKLSEYDKKEVMSIPNFDKKIFKQITGIDVDKGVMNMNTEKNLK